MTLTLALGSVLPAIGAGAIAVVAFGIGWMAGVLAIVAAALGLESLAGVAEASRWLFPSDGLWRGVVYGLEPPDRLAHRPGAQPRGPRRPTRSSRSTRRRWPSSPGRSLWIAIVLGLAAWRLVAPRPLAGSAGPSRPRRGRSAAVAEAAGEVVVDEPDALHERVDDRRADEPEPAPA